MLGNALPSPQTSLRQNISQFISIHLESQHMYRIIEKKKYKKVMITIKCMLMSFPAHINILRPSTSYCII